MSADCVVILKSDCGSFLLLCKVPGVLFVSSGARIGPVPQASFDLLERARLAERVLAGAPMPNLVRVWKPICEPHTLSGAAKAMTDAGAADVPP